jgi:ribosomal protein S27E
MSSPVYLKCPHCGKLNPTSPAEAGKEQTCVFCGAIIPPQPTGKHEDTKNKGHDRRFPLAQSESKPINRNQRKPMF